MQHIRKNPGISICKGPQQRRSADHQRHGPTVDAEAHKGALEGGTATYAVLAGGVDICYPAGNKALYERILREGGGIISEQPPGMRARNYFFPARNRIISGLADMVLIVEAREKSGSLITAQWALDQGKTVYAIPGPVNEELSIGCHKLIYDGAGIAYQSGNSSQRTGDEL